VAAPGDDPAALAEVRFDLKRLFEACERLSDGQREVISLRFGGGLSVAEAASVMGKSEGAVKVLQHAALVKLRRIMLPQRGGGGPDSVPCQPGPGAREAAESGAGATQARAPGPGAPRAAAWSSAGRILR